MRQGTASFAEVDRFAGTFSALGSGVRLRILHLLLQAAPEGISVGTIQANVKIPGSTLSHHLDRLKRHDLVTVEREGAVLRYAVNAKAMNRVAGFFLTECQPQTADVQALAARVTASSAQLPL